MENPRTGNRHIQYVIASCLSIGSIMMGMYASWIASCMPKFYYHQVDFDASSNQLEWMSVILYPGFIAGSYISRFFVDRFGRRATSLYSILPAEVGTIIIALARRPWLLYISEFLWGAATGMFNMALTIYLAEIADKEIRGGLSLITRFMFNFGNALMMTIGLFVGYRTLNYMLLALPVLFLVTCYWIPESPYYLLKEGNVEAARKALTQLRGDKDEKLLEDELSEMLSDVRNEMRRSSSRKELFTEKRYKKAVIISFVLKASQIMTGQLIIQQYLETIIKESNIGLDMTTTFIIFGFLRFIAGVMSSVSADRLGRRPLLVYSYFGTFFSLAVVGLYYFLLEIICLDREMLSPYSFVIFYGVILANVVSTLGYNSIIVVVAAETFPLNVKAVAMTDINVFGAAMNFIVAGGYQPLKDFTGLCGVFWIFGGVALAAAVFSVTYVPETKGKSLKEIQQKLQAELYEEDDNRRFSVRFCH